MTYRFERCQISEKSPAVSDLMKKSSEISKGPPARHRLLTTRSHLEKDGSVRKWTFGQRDNSMQNKILLMVGETGAGKTTLINAMVNYMFGVKFEDEVWFEITEEAGDDHTENQPDESKSQTNDITLYEAYAQDNPISLTVIDTPGYGDTRGTDTDKHIAETLLKMFDNVTGVKEIDAVCLVVKSSENRLSDRQRYIFDAVLSLFGKDIENNVVIFFTHCSGIPPRNAINAIKRAGIPCRMNEENDPDYYLFENCQTEKRNEVHNDTLQRAWKLTENSLYQFFEFLKKTNRKSLVQTESVLIESSRLEACISNLKDRIVFLECKSKELIETQEALRRNQEKINKNENFPFEITKYQKKKVPIEKVKWYSKKATICSACEENCHEKNCWCAPNPELCKVIVKGRCTSCSGKCHYSSHVKENMKYVTVSEQITMTYDELKKQNEHSDFKANIGFDSECFENVRRDIAITEEQKQKKLSIEVKLKDELARTQKEKADLVEEAYNTIMKLSGIVLKPDSASIAQHVAFLIEPAEESGEHVLVQKLRELRTKYSDGEGTAAVLNYCRRDKFTFTD